MSYYFAKTVDGDFDEAVNRTIEALKAEGFGILPDIDVQETIRKKLDADFCKDRILGICNPPLAMKALQAEDKIGTILPCNVIVQEIGDGTVEVAAADPVASMQAVENPGLAEVAGTVHDKLEQVIAGL